jgi:hypothetical protein
MLAGRPCLAYDCPPNWNSICRFKQEPDHQPAVYAARIKACLPGGALPAACLAAL